MDESLRLSRTTRVLLTSAAALASGAAFAAIARAVARRDTAPLDSDVHDGTAVEEGAPVRNAAESVAPIGKWWTYVPAAVLAGGYVAGARLREEEEPDTSSIVGSVAILASSVLAVALSKAFDHVLPQPPAPPGRPTRDHPVFPSGHAFGTLSVGLTAAYVLSREELSHAAFAFPIALVVPTTSAVARLIEEKHWISDIIGGYVAAIALAAVAATAYEAGRS